jgi:hypothetical protein
VEGRLVNWRIPVAITAVCAVAGLLLFRGAIEPREPAGRVQAADPAPPARVIAAKPEPAAPAPVAVAPKPVVPAPAAVKPPQQPPPVAPVAGEAQRVELKALQATWVGVYVNDQLTFAKVLDVDQTKTIESPETIRVRLGNAGGVEISANGKSIGPIGRPGQVRMIEFARGAFRFLPIDPAPAKNATP